MEIDINFMYRQPLWPIVLSETKFTGYSNWKAPVLDIHELAAGKLSALFDRRVSRDLFDAHHLMTKVNFSLEKLRLTLVVYLAMTKIDLATLLPEKIQYDLIDLRNRLLPVLHQKNLPRSLPHLKNWIEKLVDELKEALSTLLPLAKNEIEFIEQIRNTGEIKPELLTSDLQIVDKIKLHPALHWAAKNK